MPNINWINLFFSFFNFSFQIFLVFGVFDLLNQAQFNKLINSNLIHYKKTDYKFLVNYIDLLTILSKSFI